MRVVVQLVKKADVKISGNTVGSIDGGLLLLVGFTQTDNDLIIEKMVEKISKLRIFPDENGKTNLSINQFGGNVLSVSQFTLYGSVKDGNRPAFVEAAKAEDARNMYEKFNQLLKVKFPSLQTGIFQADMEVSLINNGPFTLILDSKELFK